MENLMEYSIGLVGVGLTFFGMAFSAWARRLKEVRDFAARIELNLGRMVEELHAYQIATERRLAHIETKLETR